MGDLVVLLASGETERHALPQLLAPIFEGSIAHPVRTPPRGKPLRADTICALIEASWWELNGRGRPPDKFVILLDTDGKKREEIIAPLQAQLRGRTSAGDDRLFFAVAQWHLEAWFFADEQGLRCYLGRNLGSVDASDPDHIQNPKNHLKQLLGSRPYSARVSGQIARALNPATIEGRSPSFASFLAALRNGSAAGASDTQ